MSPGVNDGPRNTGTVPKSNRRSDRNRERSTVNQHLGNHSTHHGYPQHSNNLLDWPISERGPLRIAKNSNTRSVSSTPSIPYQGISEIASHIGGRQLNFLTEDVSWRKMGPPVDPRVQSPPHLGPSKPTNVDKMPDRSQVESRLNQIRDYIRVTSTMMDSLSQSTDSRARAQHEKLGRMVEDLYDSETKLSKLLEQYENRGIIDENGDNRREEMDDDGEIGRQIQLRRKMEESQKKLAQLQEHQANLVGMQLHVREKLNEAREAQQALLQQENQNFAQSSSWEGYLSTPTPAKVQQLECEAEVLRGKLVQLQNKKKCMDDLVAELQVVEMSDRGSCSSEGSRNPIRDKTAELEAMKAQLAHLKVLMDEATRVRECISDQDIKCGDEVETNEEENDPNISCNSFDNEINHDKSRNSVERPTIEDVQAITRELQEQQALLQATRAQLKRLKQQPVQSAQSNHSVSMPLSSNSTPPMSVTGSSTLEKKQSNNTNGDVQPIQSKRRQLEDLMRKDLSRSSSINRDIGQDWNSQRSSNSQHSHTSAPANIWPPPTARGSHEQHANEASSDNLLNVGPQIPPLQSIYGDNWWGQPTIPPMHQPHVNNIGVGSAEYYRQLLLGSQTQQLHMMGTTIQQCCQLLLAQERELQSMRAAITQLQYQLKQPHQGSLRLNNVENSEEYSNLSRSAHHLGYILDAALPPSSSLPNLVSLPSTSSVPSHPSVTGSSNSQQHQHQHQQLNNQVPPGNRANNYWDNFRSYSRQNLLSGNVKTISEVSQNPTGNTVLSSNASSGGVNSSLVKHKRNRDQGTDNNSLPSSSGTDTQYSLNQLQSNLQHQERENTLSRNILTNDPTQQIDNFWEEPQSSMFTHTSQTTSEDQQLLSNLSIEMKQVLNSLMMTNKTRPDYLIIILREIKTISEDPKLRPLLIRSLRALQDRNSSNNPLNEATDQTASESCQSSDEDSDTAAPILGYNLDNQSCMSELIASLSPTAQMPSMDHFDMPVPFVLDGSNALPLIPNPKSGYNEDLAEADQSRPESSGPQIQNLNNEVESENGHGEAASYLAQVIHEMEPELEDAAARAEDERAEDTILDKIPTRLYHR